MAISCVPDGMQFAVDTREQHKCSCMYGCADTKAAVSRDETVAAWWQDRDTCILWAATQGNGQRTKRAYSVLVSFI